MAAQVKGGVQSEAKLTTAESAPVVAAKAADDTPNAAAPASGSTNTGTTPHTSDPNAPAAQASANVTPADPISYLQSTGISSSSRATLLTEEVLSGYATLDKSDTFVLGFKAVASLPAGSPTNTDYVTAELLELNGGILNFYLSPLARSPKNWAQQSSHLYDTDKFYFRTEPQLDCLLAYVHI